QPPEGSEGGPSRWGGVESPYRVSPSLATVTASTGVFVRENSIPMQTEPNNPGIREVIEGFAASLQTGFTSEQERLLDAILNASSDHLFVIDHAGRILYAGLN